MDEREIREQVRLMVKVFEPFVVVKALEDFCRKHRISPRMMAEILSLTSERPRVAP